MECGCHAWMGKMISQRSDVYTAGKMSRKGPATSRLSATTGARRTFSERLTISDRRGACLARANGQDDQPRSVVSAAGKQNVLQGRREPRVSRAEPPPSERRRVDRAQQRARPQRRCTRQPAAVVAVGPVTTVAAGGGPARWRRPQSSPRWDAPAAAAEALHRGLVAQLRLGN